PAEVLRRGRADPRARGDRGRHRRPAEVAAPAVPQCVDSHTAGVEVRRLAILSSAAGVKEFKGRREDDRLLTGRGRYTADWNLPEQLYGYFLRSDRAHAEILSLKIPEGFPGVKAILTGEDTADLKTPPPMVRYPGKGGSQIKVP